MPHSRFSIRRRSTFKKRSMFRRAPLFRKRSTRTRSTMAAVRRVLKNPRIGGFLGIEVKFADQTLTATALVNPSDATGGEVDPSATVVFNSVAQGDGESQRDGKTITMRSLTITGTVNTAVNNAETTASASSQIFIALVLDKQTNGTTINSEDVYTNPGGAALAATPFRNLANIKRFRVLATRKFSLGNSSMFADTTTTASISGRNLKWHMFVNLRGMQTNFTGTDGTVSTIRDNSLHLIAFTTNVDAVPTITYNSRLRYVG